jgi:membrane fusion protein, multidrug efflux system
MAADSAPAPARHHPVRLALLLLLALLLAGAGYWYWKAHRFLVTTDDAYTDGTSILIAPRAAGRVTALHVTDNQQVAAGDLLLTLDPRLQQAALDQSRANLAAAEAALAAARTQLEMTRVRAPASLAQAQAQLRAAQAMKADSDASYARQKAVDPRATTQANIDQALSQMRNNDAQVELARAQLRSASLVDQQVQSAEATVRQQEATVAQARAAVAQAELDLSFTELHAPAAGRVTMRNVERGTYVQVGQQLFYIVTPDVWVTANFKENQLTDMRPGQKVSIGVDAYPDLTLEGHVDSIQQGSGGRFSAFPAQNATGNFVKIVQRVPVKIRIDSGLPEGQGLPLGLSVTPTVRIE